MTTLILQDAATHFTLVTAKGKEIGVSFNLTDRVSVYIKRNGMSGLPMGKHFGTICEAIDTYKSAEIKAALKALAQRMGAPSYIWA